MRPGTADESFEGQQVRGSRLSGQSVPGASGVSRRPGGGECQPYPGGTVPQPPQPPTPLLRQVFPKPYGILPPSPRRSPGWSQGPGHDSPPPASAPPGQTVIVIAPSALPGHAGVQIAATPGARWIGPVQVVYASPQCTGS
jgi:hypothetical protein